MLVVQGNLSKMRTQLQDGLAHYSLVLDENQYYLNDYISSEKQHEIRIEFLNQINCIYCQREIKKTFNQGYCFPCFRALARCDSCIMSPENCHFHLGTCREPEWGKQHCMQDHVVYIANSSGVKVGLTRVNQIPTRWIDQGAVQALIIARLASRYQAGLLEVICKQHLSDRTNWRAMLKNEVDAKNLIEVREQLYSKITEELSELELEFNNNQIKWDNNENIFEICYPVSHYPKKIVSYNLDKNNIAAGNLIGIKGQYMILDSGVINLRKYTGYKVKITIN